MEISVDVKVVVTDSYAFRRYLDGIGYSGVDLSQKVFVEKLFNPEEAMGYLYTGISNCISSSEEVAKNHYIVTVECVIDDPLLLHTMAKGASEYISVTDDESAVKALMFSDLYRDIFYEAGVAAQD